jgi:hypothetical protein
VDHQHRRSHLGDLVDAAAGGQTAGGRGQVRNSGNLRFSLFHAQVCVWWGGVCVYILCMLVYFSCVCRHKTININMYTVNYSIIVSSIKRYKCKYMDIQLFSPFRRQ